MAQLISETVVTTLEQRGLIGKQSANTKVDKTAYQKTEQLLYNYMGFQKIVKERMREIEEIRMFGVPQRCGGVTERVQSSPTQSGIVLPEESVEAAVKQLEHSNHEIIRVLHMIDGGLNKISKDPYYLIIPMRYFEGRTLEDIGVEFNRDQATIGRNSARLVKELSMNLFPDQYVNEIMN